MQNKKKLGIIAGIAISVVLILCLVLAIEGSTRAEEITKEQAQTIVDEALSSALGVSPQSSAKRLSESSISR